MTTGTKVLVTGAGGSIGAVEIARAKPDGMTLGIATVSTHGVTPAVIKRVPYDPVADFTPIAELVNAPAVLVVHPSVPGINFNEFVKYLKSNPGKLNYGSPGLGSAGQMAAEIFKRS